MRDSQPPLSIPTVTVCICTYRRPSQLAELLSRLAGQDGPAGFTEVIVVDNDAAASARSVVAAARSQDLPFLLHYDVQPEKNIALTRNRTIAMATGRWIAFIDDDELPSPRWLANLLQTVSEHNAEGVMGPVIPVLPESAPGWIQRGRFYDRQRFSTGTVVPRDQFRTSNALCAADVLRRIEGPFNPAYGLTGGSDAHLFNQLANLGARFVWCDEAEVEELVGDKRLRLRWLLMRRFRGGNDFARLTVTGAYGPVRPWTIPIFAGRAFAQLCIAAAASLVALPLGRTKSAGWLLRVFSNAGKLAALVGLRYREYA
jgi:succinoglycan biosynthesis protein ExoM